jgi:magnesium transporter
MILPYPSEDLANATWIDLFRPTSEEMERVNAVTKLRVPSESQISEIESTSRLAFESGSFYVSTPLVGHVEGDQHALIPVGFVLSSRVLLTVRFAALPSFDEAHETCKAAKPRTAEEAFLHILEAIVDRAADKLEHAGAQCDEISRGAFRAPTGRAASGHLQQTLRRVGLVADRISLVRDGLLGVGRIGAYIMDAGFEGAPPVNSARLQAIRADVSSLMEYEAHLSSKVQFLLDATLGFINIEQNEIVKTLTIVSVVGVPPVLIAGIYGMNFRNMPELGWRYGYPYALGLIVVSALIPLVWFKLRHWM